MNRFTELLPSAFSRRLRDNGGRLQAIGKDTSEHQNLTFGKPHCII
ncbi:MAG: hypothetical protein RL478_1090 [Actinomycetota bacterium]